MQKIENQLDIFTLIQTIQKLRAGLDAVIGNNLETIDKAKDLYLQNIIVHEDSEEERQSQGSFKSSEFSLFMDT